MYSLFLVGITLIALILCNLTVSINVLIPYSGLFSWGEILVKSWKRLSGIKFVEFNFVARSPDVMWTLNLGHMERILLLTRKASVSSLAWEAIVSVYYANIVRTNQERCYQLLIVDTFWHHLLLIWTWIWQSRHVLGCTRNLWGTRKHWVKM